MVAVLPLAAAGVGGTVAVLGYWKTLSSPTRFLYVAALLAIVYDSLVQDGRDWNTVDLFILIVATYIIRQVTF
jgi:hypothetical protein